MMFANAFREHCGIFIDEFGQIILDLPHWRDREFIHRYFVPDRYERTFACKTDGSPAETERGTDHADPAINVSVAGGDDSRVKFCDSSTQTDLCGTSSLFHSVPDAHVAEYRDSDQSHCSSL